MRYVVGFSFASRKIVQMVAVVLRADRHALWAIRFSKQKPKWKIEIERNWFENICVCRCVVAVFTRTNWHWKWICIYFFCFCAFQHGPKQILWILWSISIGLFFIQIFWWNETRNGDFHPTNWNKLIEIKNIFVHLSIWQHLHWMSRVVYVSFEIYVNRSEPIHEVRDHRFFATRCFNIFMHCANERMLCNLCIYSVIHFHATISHRRGSNKINYKMHRTRRIVSVLSMVTENAMRIYRNDNYDAIRFNFHFHYHSVPKIHPAIHARHAEDTIQNYTKCIKAKWEMWIHSFHSEPSSITELCESAH